jgi:hypothetical protein
LVSAVLALCALLADKLLGRQAVAKYTNKCTLQELVESWIIFVRQYCCDISSRPALGSTQPPIKWVPGALSPGVNRQGREGDHSPPTSAEVKKMWTYTSTPLYVYMA